VLFGLADVVSCSLDLKWLARLRLVCVVDAGFEASLGLAVLTVVLACGFG
jgi:hypothetical protein